MLVIICLSIYSRYRKLLRNRNYIFTLKSLARIIMYIIYFLICALDAKGFRA